MTYPTISIEAVSVHRVVSRLDSKKDRVRQKEGVRSRVLVWRMRSRFLGWRVRSRVLGGRVRSRLNPSHITQQHDCRGFLAYAHQIIGLNRNLGGRTSVIGINLRLCMTSAQSLDPPKSPFKRGTLITAVFKLVDYRQ
ncbi:hypothetical protein [Coleofasciculus chthonoplastes]|uniref:hypothetical protein n=1 Tax=Coleofasciculus chthonoplastes TaxID=64178 RepID=UPI0032F6AF86